MMAQLHNMQPVRGVVNITDGRSIYNGRPVIGVRIAGNGVPFTGNKIVFGVDVLADGATMHNDQPVCGVVLIEDGSDLHNMQEVIPVSVLSGSLGGGGGGGDFSARNADILFQGHSLVDNRLMHAFRSWNEQASVAANVQQTVIIGAPSWYIWSNSATATGVDSRAYLVSPGTDAFVYAEGGPLDATGGSAAAPKLPIDYGNRWCQLAWENAARPLLYAIWPYTNTGTTEYQTEFPADPFGAMTDWRAKIDTLRGQYERIIGYVHARAPVGAAPFRLVPADALMAELYDTALAGNLIGVGSTQAAFYAAMFTDNIHLTVYGWYAVACLHYACVYGQSPVGLSTIWEDDFEGLYAPMPTGPQAAQLQAIAWAVAQADPLGPWGAQIPDDPYAASGGGGVAWWTPNSNDHMVSGNPQTVTAMTVAMSFRFGAGDMDVSGAAPDLLFSEQFVRLQVSGGDDATGRGLACQLVTTGWSQTDLGALASNFMAVDEVQNVVLIYSAAGLPSGNTAEVWVNETLVLSTAAAIPNVGMQKARVMSNGAQINVPPNQGDTQGWWISYTTAVPAATMFADLFDGANGIRDDLSGNVIADVTPDYVQIGPL